MNKSTVNRYVFIVMTNSVPDREDEFNQWYTDVHLPDLLKVPGVVAAERFVAAPESGKTSPYKYLAIYEIETSNIDAVRNAFRRISGTPDMAISPALDRTNMFSIYFQQVGAKLST